MGTSLCSTCGERLDDSQKFCPKCGAKNYKNVEAQEELIENAVQTKKAAGKFLGGFHAVTLIFGLIFAVAGIVLTVLNMDDVLLLPESFICAVGGGVAAVFSIIGLARKEDTMKVCGISLLIAGGSALFLAYLMM